MNFSKLNHQQHIFIEEYIKTRNVGKAVEKAGYCDISYGSQLLNKAKIKAEIERRYKIMQAHNTLSVERVMKEEKALAYADPLLHLLRDDQSPIPPAQLPEQVRRCIAGIDVIERTDKDGAKITTYKYRFWDKGKALERISRHLGLYNDKIRIEFDQGLQIVMQVLPEQVREQVVAKVLEMQAQKLLPKP